MVVTGFFAQCDALAVDIFGLSQTERLRTPEFDLTVVRTLNLWIMKEHSMQLRCFKPHNH